MTNVKKEHQWTNRQLQKLLDTKHIRQHLMKVGLIDRYGEVVSKEEYEYLHKHRSRRRRRRRRSSSKIVDRQTIISRPSTTIDLKYPIETRRNSKQYRRTSTSQSKRRSKSPSPYPPIRAKSISVQRPISAKIVSINNRCLVTMIYYGPQTILDYDRSLFEPEGDEIVVMQQHCGGENLVVYKGRLKANETFQFESRRHIDYPFALAFYVNGLVDHRLSICCEARHKRNVRIGGKRGLFGIINVEKSRPCERCRSELRMKRLAELKASRHLPTTYRISTPEPNFTRSNSPEFIVSPRDRSESPTLNEELKRIDLLNVNSRRRVSIVSSGKGSNDGRSTRNNRSDISGKENTDQ